MKMIRKMTALLLALCVALGAVSCSTADQSWSAEKDGDRLPVGVYVYNLYAAISLAQTQDGVDTSAGDTWYDAAGAQKTGVDFIGALYGYGKKEEMQAYGAASFVNSVPELVPLLFPTGALGSSACLNEVYLSRGEENDGQNHI